MFSADLEEFFLLADRSAFLYRGELGADMPAERASMDGIGALMLQGREAAA